MDLTDTSSINSFITKLKPDFLIHSAAQRFPDKMQENPEQARLLNVEATKVLAESMSKSPNDYDLTIDCTVFENHRKSLILYCERSELRLHFEWATVK